MSLDSDVYALRQVEMFSHFSDDQLRLLAFSAEARRFRDGYQLFSVGDRSDAGFVVARGAIGITVLRQGRQEVVRRALAGDLVGDLALIAETQHQTGAVALGDVEVIQIRRATFRRVLEEYPDVAVRLRDHIAARLLSLSDELRSVGTLLSR